MSSEQDLSTDFEDAVDKLCANAGVTRGVIRSLNEARAYVMNEQITIEQATLALYDELTVSVSFEESLSVRGWLPS